MKKIKGKNYELRVLRHVPSIMVVGILWTCVVFPVIATVYQVHFSSFA